jgi:hypothetical protein
MYSMAKENILYICGAASNRGKPEIAAEEYSMQRKGAALKKAGFRVTRVGNARQGFTLQDIATAFARQPELQIVIAEIHGNVQDNQHSIAPITRTDKKKDVFFPASVFYSMLRNCANGRPLDLFMLSCGSGFSCQEAAKILPDGSTFVNLMGKPEVIAYNILPQSLSAANASAENPAETIFLSIMANGLAMRPYRPHITVTGSGESAVWDLWKLACKETLRGKQFTRSALFDLARELYPYMSLPRLEEAADVIEIYRDGIKTRPPRFRRLAGTPFASAEKELRPHEFFDAVMGYQRIGPVCALAYMINRDRIQSFRARAIRKQLTAG